MTPSQLRSFYFRAWGECARALGWGRAPARLESWGAPAVDDLYQSAWNTAEALASWKGRAVCADDLRHGCHIVALGFNKSAKYLTNAEADRVVALFRLLAAPDDLEAMLAWMNPDVGVVRRLLRSIEHLAPTAYVEAVARDKFGTRLWRTTKLCHGCPREPP